MASIQVLDIRPVDDQIEELSYDLTNSITGGGVSEALSVFETTIDFAVDLIARFGVDAVDEAVQVIVTGTYLAIQALFV